MMIAFMARAAGVLLILAGGLYGATAANEALLCVWDSSRHFDVTIRHCSAAIESGGLSDAGLAAVLGRRCQAYGEKHDYARALPDCERAVQLAPNSALQIYRRGLVRFYSGNLDGAMLDSQQAINLDPNMAIAYTGRASVYIERAAAATCDAARVEQYDRAIQDYGEALRLNRKGETYYGRGWCRFQAHYYDSAREDFDEAIRRGEGAGAYYYRGRCYIHDAEYGRAMADFDQAIHLDPNVADSYSSRAWVHGRRGEYNQAISDYTEALRLSPNAETYKARGSAFYHEGAYLLALWDFARASWRFWVPLVLLVLLISGLGRLRRAKKAHAATEESDECPAADDLEPLVESSDAPEEEPATDPEPLQADTDLDVLIRTGMRDRVAIGYLENLLREADIPFFVMDQNAGARQESGNIIGWWNIRVPHEREAEAREIIRAVEEMK
jgi:tetratricopeptide (TPR) repeat protein